MSQDMLKLVYLLRRRSELSREDFQTYWRDRHAPLVAAFAERLDIARYTQSHAIDTSLGAAMAGARGCLEPDFDGVAELWLNPSNGRTGAAPEQFEAARALLEDEGRFIDLSRSVLFFTREQVIVPASDKK